MPISAEEKAQAQRAAQLLAALSHPGRLQIVWWLGRKGAQNAGEIAEKLDIEASALSHQLRILREAGLVKVNRNGRQKIYEVTDHHVQHIVEDAIKHADELHEAAI